MRSRAKSQQRQRQQILSARLSVVARPAGWPLSERGARGGAAQGRVGAPDSPLIDPSYLASAAQTRGRYLERRGRQTGCRPLSAAAGIPAIGIVIVVESFVGARGCSRDKRTEKANVRWTCR